MTLNALLLDLYRRLNFPTTPPAAVTTRLTALINQAHRDLLGMPNMRRLRDGELTFVSVANQARYGLPPAVARVNTLRDTTNQWPLPLLHLDDLRWIDAPLTATGTPTQDVPLGYQQVQQQPAAATGLWVVSTAAGDTTQTVSVEALSNAGGAVHVPTPPTLNGTTRVQVGTLTDYLEIDKFYLSAPAVGLVSLWTAAAAGTELARIPIGAISAQYLAVQLWPTPSAAITYSLDYTRNIPELILATDEPALPPDFHRLLINGALRFEYQRMDDSRYPVAVKEWDDDLQKLQQFIGNWAQERWVPEIRPGYGRRSNLNGFYPPGVW